MDVLVVGSGAREHALAWALSRSPSTGNVYIMPGNPGTAQCGTNVLGWTGDSRDFQNILDLCMDKDISLVVVGPENPLAEGLADCLREKGIPVFGPGKSGARLEASKSFAKDFMARHGIPDIKHLIQLLKR
jgi:phosphoribosylamine-glycine ligase